MNVVTVTSENFEKEVLQAELAVVDFWASWCGPCKMLSPIVDEIAGERSDIKVCKVNVDDESELAARFNVMSIPTLLVFKNGQLTNQSVGYRDKNAVLSLI